MYKIKCANCQHPLVRLMRNEDLQLDYCGYCAQHFENPFYGGNSSPYEIAKIERDKTQYMNTAFDKGLSRAIDIIQEALNLSPRLDFATRNGMEVAMECIRSEMKEETK